MDKEKIKKAIKALLGAIGENSKRQGLSKAPEKIAEMLEEVLSGKNKDVKNILKGNYDSQHDEIILVKNVPFYSMCEHHLLPFFGKCHVAYIPKGNKIIGVSKLAEAIGVMSKKLHVQEKLTNEIADKIMKYLKPKGVGVAIVARHLCMEMMGTKQPSAEVATFAVRGLFRKSARAREEFFGLIK